MTQSIKYLILQGAPDVFFNSFDAVCRKAIEIGANSVECTEYNCDCLEDCFCFKGFMVEFFKSGLISLSNEEKEPLPYKEETVETSSPLKTFFDVVDFERPNAIDETIKYLSEITSKVEPEESNELEFLEETIPEIKPKTSRRIGHATRNVKIAPYDEWDRFNVNDVRTLAEKLGYNTNDFATPKEQDDLILKKAEEIKKVRHDAHRAEMPDEIRTAFVGIEFYEEKMVEAFKTQLQANREFIIHKFVYDEALNKYKNEK